MLLVISSLTIKIYEAEQRQRALERQIRKWKRIEAGSIDEENKYKANKAIRNLEKQLREHLDKNKELRRNRNREKII